MKEHLHTQSHIASPSHFSSRVHFVVSCPDGGCDESANNTELRPAGRQSHGPLKEDNMKNVESQKNQYWLLSYLSLW